MKIMSLNGLVYPSILSNVLIAPLKVISFFVYIFFFYFSYLSFFFLKTSQEELHFIPQDQTHPKKLSLVKILKMVHFYLLNREKSLGNLRLLTSFSP